PGLLLVTLLFTAQEVMAAIDNKMSVNRFIFSYLIFIYVLREFTIQVRLLRLN
ncbi:MAG: hypothetical protein ACI9GZ_001046, partial [Bacteroidia bacterium]